ncbi:MAG: menaquinone biosynthetic enzyme MqnA/MqnD family protein [Bacteroidota bacterium]|jgi:chorismate dehydratase
MSSTFRISVVSYLNAKPYLSALNRLSAEHFQIEEDVPARCAQKLIAGDVDLGLIPAAVIPKIQHPHFVPGFGIAANGRVDSVLLLSKVPISHVLEVVLDMESRTSVQLARILAREYWDIQPTWVNESESGKPLESGEHVSIVVIGDRALELAPKYEFVYDLADAWKSHTGLPFVFAAWVSPRAIPDEKIEALTAAFEFAANPEESLLGALQAAHPSVNVREYLTKRIIYRLGEAEYKGLHCFLQKLSNTDSIAASGSTQAR